MLAFRFMRTISSEVTEWMARFTMHAHMQEIHKLLSNDEIYTVCQRSPQPQGHLRPFSAGNKQQSING